MKTGTKKINVARKTASILGSRDIIQTIEELVSKTSAKKVNLDFSDVDFISRSAAYELIRLKEKASYVYKKELHFINLKDNVSQILKAIASQMAVEEKKMSKVRVKRKNIASVIN